MTIGVPLPLKLLGLPASLQLNVLFTFTYLFVNRAQPDRDGQRTDKQTNYRPTPIVIGEQ